MVHCVHCCAPFIRRIQLFSPFVLKYTIGISHMTSWSWSLKFGLGVGVLVFRAEEVEWLCLSQKVEFSFEEVCFVAFWLVLNVLLSFCINFKNTVWKIMAHLSSRL